MAIPDGIEPAAGLTPQSDDRYRETAEQALERMAILQSLSRRLAIAHSADYVCRVVVDHVLETVDPSGVALVWYVDPAGHTTLGARTPLAPGRRGAPAPGDGPPALAPDLGGFAAALADDPSHARPWLTPELSQALRDLTSGPPARLRTATLLAGGSVVGALALLHDETVAADALERMGTVVRLAGEALGRALSVAEALRLAAIVESSDDLMNAMGLDGTILTWNPASERITGCAAHEVVGRNVSILAPAGELDDATGQAIERIRDGGEAERLIVRRRRKDGTLFWLAMTISPMRDEHEHEHGRLVSFAITARDISAQVMAEQRMRRLAAVVEAAPGAVAVVDRCGRIEECNRSAQALFGDGCRDLVGADRSVLVTDRDRAAWDEVFAAAEAGRSLTLDAVRRTAADGGDVTLRLSGFPVLADGGEVVAMAMLALDVTESERLADALRHAQTLESLGRLAGGIAHDFNNMLTVITGYVTLARRYAGDGRAVQPIDEIATAADRMQGLTRQLLAFARRESVAPTRLDLREVVAALAPMLRSLIGPAVTITLDMPEPVPRLLADRSKLEQVVVNLVANARDAMGAGGEVTISVQSPSCAAEDPAHRFVVLAVADTGEGMTPEVAKRIFEPFFSTKPAAESGAGSGTGLGLATVHGIVTSAGGEITVDSAVGRGTTFTLRFPADPTPDIAPPQEADPTRDGALGELGALGVSRASEPALASEVGPAAAPDAAHVLVCDDEAPLLALVAGALEEGGHTVHPFSDPQQALAFAADVAHRIDLIVTDVLMPGMPGPALAERVLALRPGLPVCFMSGFAPAAIDAAAWPAGCVVFDKPFDVSELVQAVHGLLEARAALG